MKILNYDNEAYGELIEKMHSENCSCDMTLLDENDIPYLNPCDPNKIKVSDYFICYFDIMAYHCLIEKYGENHFLKIIYALMDVVSETLSDIKCHIFSDNIIFFSPISENDDLNNNRIVEIIKQAFLLQRNLMGQYRIILRGAITTGNLFYNGNFIYGNGLIKSYDMESKEAVYPRIIIDSDIIDNNKYVLDICKNWVSVDDDDRYFISYLSLQTGLVISLSYLNMHKEFVRGWLKQPLSDCVKKKYEWCKKYHNYICELYKLTSFIID